MANPPYMGAKNMNAWLSGWVKKSYPDVKGDLFSCFMVRNTRMGSEHAQLGFMTPYVWMFIGTYEKLREFVVKKNTITSLIQLEYSGFSGATVPICTFTLQKGCCPGYRGGYVRLSDFVGADQQEPRALQALADPDCGWFYRADAKSFECVPGGIIAYWSTDTVRKTFSKGTPLRKLFVARDGIHACDRGESRRFWWEIDFLRSSCGKDCSDRPFKWIMYNKGGSYRKWKGNDAYVINWENDGEKLRSSPKAHGFNGKYALLPSVTWSSVSSGKPSFRIKAAGFMFDAAGYSMFPLSEVSREEACGFANSSVASKMLSFLSPTMNYQAGDILSMPMIGDKEQYLQDVTPKVNDCCTLSQTDWDMLETSWGFKRHFLI